jgi:hypothetical protein
MRAGRVGSFGCGDADGCGGELGLWLVAASETICDIELENNLGTGIGHCGFLRMMFLCTAVWHI